MTPRPPASRKRARAAGEGSLRQRPDGTWEARYTAGWTPEGKQVRRSVYGRTRAEVADKLKLKLAGTERGAVVLAEQGRLTLADYAEAFVESRRGELGEGTILRLESDVRALRRQPVGQKALTEIRPVTLERLYASLAEEYAPGTVRRLRTFVNQVLRRAVRHEIIRSHPGLAADLPRMKEQRAGRALEPDELARVLVAARATPHARLFMLIAALGLRHGEALGLQWGDLDWKAGTLDVRRTVVSRAGKPTVSQPKTARAQRTLYLTPALQVILLGQRRDLEERGLPVGGEAWVFPNSLGGMLGQPNVRRVWRQVLKAAGVPKCRIHDLRHTFVSRVIEGGADPRVAADLAGHADPRMTLSIYTHTRAEKRKEALLASMRHLDELLSQEEPESREAVGVN